MDAAEESLKQMKRLRGGLNEWQILMQSDQAATLRAALEDDIQTAEALITDEMTLDALAESS
jgi:hypothetical protein